MGIINVLRKSIASDDDEIRYLKRGEKEWSGVLGNVFAISMAIIFKEVYGIAQSVIDEQLFTVYS